MSLADADPTLLWGLIAALGALALIALVIAVRTALWARRLRRADQALLDGEPVDLVEFAVGMEARMERIETDAEHLRDEVLSALGALDTVLRRRAIVRFDAVPDETGLRSSAIALLDRNGTGIVVSAIHTDERTSIFAKEVLRGGPASLDLTEEERRAVAHALR
jgi:hypothetical protein